MRFGSQNKIRIENWSFSPMQSLELNQNSNIELSKIEFIKWKFTNLINDRENYIEDCFRNRDKKYYSESKNQADITYNKNLLKVFLLKLYSKRYLRTYNLEITFDECFGLKDKVAQKVLENVEFWTWVKNFKFEKKSAFTHMIKLFFITFPEGISDICFGNDNSEYRISKHEDGDLRLNATFDEITNNSIDSSSGESSKKDTGMYKKFDINQYSFIEFTEDYGEKCLLIGKIGDEKDEESGCYKYQDTLILIKTETKTVKFVRFNNIFSIINYFTEIVRITSVQLSDEDPFSEYYVFDNSNSDDESYTGVGQKTKKFKKSNKNFILIDFNLKKVILY